MSKGERKKRSKSLKQNWLTQIRTVGTSLLVAALMAHLCWIFFWWGKETDFIKQKPKSNTVDKESTQHGCSRKLQKQSSRNQKPLTNLQKEK